MSVIAHLDVLEADARIMLRTFGPRVGAAQDENIAIRHCRRCSPTPKVYQCIICGFASQEKWRFDVHNRINPETCQRAAQRWAKAYADAD